MSTFHLPCCVLATRAAAEAAQAASEVAVQLLEKQNDAKAVGQEKKRLARLQEHFYKVLGDACPKEGWSVTNIVAHELASIRKDK
jgi:hypothetical protein